MSNNAMKKMEKNPKKVQTNKIKSSKISKVKVATKNKILGGKIWKH